MRHVGWLLIIYDVCVRACASSVYDEKFEFFQTFFYYFIYIDRYVFYMYIPIILETLPVQIVLFSSW